jgi:hypothetical protein
METPANNEVFQTEPQGYFPSPTYQLELQFLFYFVSFYLCKQPFT